MCCPGAFFCSYWVACGTLYFTTGMSQYNNSLLMPPISAAFSLLLPPLSQYPKRGCDSCAPSIAVFIFFLLLKFKTGQSCLHALQSFLICSLKASPNETRHMVMVPTQEYRVIGGWLWVTLQIMGSATRGAYL